MSVAVKVTNLAETFLTFCRLVEAKTLPEQLSLWETRHAQIRPDVLNFTERITAQMRLLKHLAQFAEAR